MLVDRVLLTLANLRLDMPHAALAELFDVDRCTVTKAIGQIRPLLARLVLATPTAVGPRRTCRPAGRDRCPGPRRAPSAAHHRMTGRAGPGPRHRQPAAPAPAPQGTTGPARGRRPPPSSPT
ncbi:transposase family protein [Streptomyces sp. NPDC017979]|uniref:transposase family protein n=1 Tax=Streptomyces sp. NPDC017979 TaxID=3365024 RepID=UPI00379BFCC9